MQFSHDQVNQAAPRFALSENVARNGLRVGGSL